MKYPTIWPYAAAALVTGLLAGCGQVATPAGQVSDISAASLAPVGSSQLLLKGTSGYTIAGAQSVPETFSLSLTGQGGASVNPSSVTLCAAGANAGDLSVTPVPGQSGEYALQESSSAQGSDVTVSLELKSGANCSGSLVDQAGTSTPLSLPSVTLTQAVFVSVIQGSGSPPIANFVLAYTADGSQLPFELTRQDSLNVPEGLAYDPQDQQIYVANYGGGSFSGSVTAYSVSSGAASSSFSLSSLSQGSTISNPYALAYGLVGGQQQLFVLNSGSGDLLAYSATSGVLSTNFPAVTSTNGLESTQGIAYDPQNGEIYAANYQSGSVTAYSASTGIQQAFNVSSSQADGVAYDPQNQQIYVTNYSSGTPSQSTVTAYAISSQKSVLTIQGGLNGAFGIAYDPVNQQIYVANYGAEANSAGINGTGTNVVSYDASGSPVSLSGGATSAGAISTKSYGVPQYVLVVP